MEFCRFLRSVKFVVRSLGRFLGRGVFRKMADIMPLPKETPFKTCTQQLDLYR